MPETVAIAARARPHEHRASRGHIAVRRLSDHRGMVWQVRDVWSTTGHALLFQCAVSGIRSELHSVDTPLAALSDDELLDVLMVTDD